METTHAGIAFFYIGGILILYFFFYIIDTVKLIFYISHSIFNNFVIYLAWINLYFGRGGGQ